MDLYSSCLQSSCCLILEAAGRRNRLEWCWWQVKINAHREIETEHTKALCSSQWCWMQNMTQLHCQWQSTVHAACPLLLMADLTQSHGLLKMSEWMGAYNKVIRGEVGGSKWPQGWIRLISCSFVRHCLIHGLYSCNLRCLVTDAMTNKLQKL